MYEHLTSYNHVYPSQGELFWNSSRAASAERARAAVNASRVCWVSLPKLQQTLQILMYLIAVTHDQSRRCTSLPCSLLLRLCLPAVLLVRLAHSLFAELVH